MTDTKPPLDIDALLAIVRRVSGKLYASKLAIGISNENDRAAIVAAVNNFEALAERCKRAEEWNDYDATIADLTRQRDELLAVLRNIADKDDYAADDPHGCLDCIIGIAKASVKERSDCGTPQGMADGEA